ncbi:hypothetical protein C8R44DRAFT_819221 [Mycena epipterygia]|nr:hypothetical protein C8R44DRAFT_819221 [Mycena epipterygia]
MAAPNPLPPIIAPRGLSALGVPPPAQPAAGVTSLLDIYNAHEYNTRLAAARQSVVHGPGNLAAPSQADVAEGLIYEKRVIDANAGQAVAPPWFSQWNRQSFEPFVRRMDTHVARSANQSRATGHQAPFAILDFLDGSDPTGPVHGLPALRNTSNIRALTSAQSTLYCTNYGIIPAGNHASRKKHIATYIGYFGAL